MFYLQIIDFIFTNLSECCLKKKLFILPNTEVSQGRKKDNKHASLRKSKRQMNNMLIPEAKGYS